MRTSIGSKGIAPLKKRLLTAFAIGAAALHLGLGNPCHGNATATWNASSGNWSNAADWSPATEPNNGGTLYNVTLSGGTLTLDVNPTIQQLNISGGTLTGTGTTLTLDDLFTWTGGTIGAAASTQTINASAGMSISGNVKFAGGTINNSGTATWSGTGGGIQAYGKDASGEITTFNNQAGASFNVQSDETYSGNGLSFGISFPDMFNNAGTFTKSVTTGTTTMGVLFNNSNTVNVQTGTLALGGGGTQTGSFAISGGATLQISGGTSTFQSGSSISGAGSVTITGGTASFSTGAADSISLPVSLSGGGLTGTDTINLSSTFNWTGGTVGAAGSSQTLNPNGGMNISGSVNFSGGTINNTGATTWSGTGGQINAGGQNTAGHNTTFNNLLGASFLVQCDKAYTGNGTGSTAPDMFNNAGTFTKSVTTGTTTIDVQFNNSNAVNVQTGTLALNGGGNQTGSFAVSSGAALQFSGGTANFQSGGSISGAGGVTISGGTVNFSTGAADSIPLTVGLSGGTLTGTDTINAGGLFTWTGGTIGAAASTQTLNASGGMSISGNVNFSGGTLNNPGAATWSGTGGQINANGQNHAGQNTTFNNQAGASFNIQSDEYYYGNALGSTAPDVFNNAGTLTKSLTTGTTNITAEFNNSNVVNVQSGTLSFNGGGTQTGSFAISSGATLQFGGNTANFQNGSSVTGGGNFAVNGGGVVNFNPGSTYTPLGATNVSGVANFNSSGVSISGALILGGHAIFTTGNTVTPSTITVNSGSLAGSDTITTSGAFTWTSGTLGAAGGSQIFNANGGMNISGSSGFAGGTINNAGIANWTGSGGQISASGQDSAGQITIFNNLTGANFDVQSDQTYYANGSGPYTSYPDQFNNAGIFTKSLTTGTTDIQAQFNNSNIVNVQTGTLSLDGGGTQTGSFTVSSGAALRFNGGIANFQSGSTVGGAGSPTFANGTINFNSGSSYGLLGSVTVSGGDVSFSTGAAGVAIPSLNLSNGAVAGTDTIGVSGVVTWSGGTFGAPAGTQILNANGGMSISGSVKFPGGTINNAAAVLWTGTGGSINAYGQNILGQNTTFNNLAGATFTVQSDEYYYGYTTNNAAADLFNNAGIFTKSLTTGTTDILAEFNNSNIVNVQTGTLSLDGGGNQTGSFAVSSGATLQVNGGSANFQSGGSITGAGSVTVAGGTLSFNTGAADTIPSVLNLHGGTLAGADTVNVAGAFNWSGGTIGTVGSTQNLNLNDGMAISGKVTFVRGTINNAGIATWSGTNGQINAQGQNVAGQNTIFNNNAGANFNVQCDETYYGIGLGTVFSTVPDLFNNAGTFTKSVTTGTTIIEAQFNNANTVNVQTGTLSLNGGGYQTGTFAVSSGATLEFNGGDAYFQSGSSITGAGTVIIAGGTSLAVPIVNFSTGSVDSIPLPVKFSGGILTGSDTINVAGAFTWTGGTIGSTGSTQTLNANGGMSISANVGVSGGIINNLVAATWSGGSIAATGNTTFNNQAGATFNVQCDQTYSGNALGTTSPDVFNNAGTFTKSVTTGTTKFGVEFNNSNMVNVQTGTLSLAGGGTQTGSFAVSSGATLLFSGGTSNVQSGGSVTGAGNVSFTGGTVNFNTGSSYNGTGPLAIAGGTVNFNTSATVSSPSSFTISSGTLAGTGTITTSVPVVWTGGNIGAPDSTQVLNAGAGVSMSGSVGFPGGTINNTATFTWAGVGGQFYAVGQETLGENTTFNNQPGAIFNVHSDEFYAAYGSQWVAPDVFNNAGTFTKSLTAGTTNMEAVFNNSSIVNVQTGILSLDGGGTQTGSFNVSSGATLQFNGGTFKLQSGSSISGSGNATFVSGTVNFNSGSSYSLPGSINAGGATVRFNTGAAVTPSSLTISSGTVSGSDTITPSGPVTWTGGAVGAAGSTQTLNANGGMSINGTVTFAGGTINNAGTATWSGTGGKINATGQNTLGQNTIFNNLAGANFNVQSDEIYSGYGSQYPIADLFNNAGTLTKSVTTGTTTFQAQFNNSGTVNAQSGTIDFAGGFTQTAGVTKLSSGSVASDPTLNFNGGELTGSGLIAAPVTLAGSSTSLDFVLDGETPGAQAGQYDQLNIGGNVVLGGNLGITLTPGFTPAPTDGFTVLALAGGDSLTGSFLNAADGSRLQTTDGSGSFMVNYESGANAAQIVLDDYQASVPEPASLALLALAVSALMMRPGRRD